MMAGSHPLWVRGLKYKFGDLDEEAAEVAPFMGAWIEILKMWELTSLITVAPFMGAWIEITDGETINHKAIPSHPLWVRGLKFRHRLPWKILP